MRFAFADSRPSCPSRARRGGDAAFAADSGDVDGLGRHGRMLPPAASRSACFRAELELTLRLGASRRGQCSTRAFAELFERARPALRASAGSGAARAASARRPSRRARGRTAASPFDDSSDETPARSPAKPAERRTSVCWSMHAHLERPVLRARPCVPVTARFVAGRRLLPRTPSRGGAAAFRQSASPAAAPTCVERSPVACPSTNGELADSASSTGSHGTTRFEGSQRGLRRASPRGHAARRRAACRARRPSSLRICS